MMQLFSFVVLVILKICCLTHTVRSAGEEKVNKGTNETPSKFNVIVLENGDHKCKGGIIGKDVILATANCFFDQVTGKLIHDNFTVLAPVSKEADYDDLSKIYEIDKIYIPKCYQPANPNPEETCNIVGDIAVIRLKKDVTLKPKKNPYKWQIPETFLTYLEKIAILFGFGSSKPAIGKDPNMDRFIEVGKSGAKLRFFDASLSPNLSNNNVHSSDIHSTTTKNLNIYNTNAYYNNGDKSYDNTKVDGTNINKNNADDSTVDHTKNHNSAIDNSNAGNINVDDSNAGNDNVDNSEARNNNIDKTTIYKTNIHNSSVHNTYVYNINLDSKTADNINAANINGLDVSVSTTNFDPNTNNINVGNNKADNSNVDNLDDNNTNLRSTNVNKTNIHTYDFSTIANQGDFSIHTTIPVDISQSQFAHKGRVIICNASGCNEQQTETTPVSSYASFIQSAIVDKKTSDMRVFTLQKKSPSVRMYEFVEI